MTVLSLTCYPIAKWWKFDLKPALYSHALEPKNLGHSRGKVFEFYMWLDEDVKNVDIRTVLSK